jgi:hypothetical protein
VHCVLAVAATAACWDGASPTASEQPRVSCRDLDAGYEAIYTGDGALAECMGDPRMQQAGHRREARLGAGRFDFGAATRLELDAGWTVEGAGADQTFLFASRPTRSVFQDEIRSALLVRGARVRLARFTFDGACSAGPSPDPECAGLPDHSLLALVVACGYGMEPPPECDVDGLVVEDVRVLHVKTTFLATSSMPHPERGEKGLFANFLDLHWTIRRFQVSDVGDGFRYARIFELGNGATPYLSQGPGVGVTAPRRYVVDVEDVEIDAPVGMHGGQLAGVLTVAVNAPVTLELGLRRSRLVGTERIVGIATHAVARRGSDGGRVLFRCEDSLLQASPRDWEQQLRRQPGGAPCPPLAAALRLGEFSRPGGSHAVRAELRRCEVRAEPFLALCPAPLAVELPAPDAGLHTSLCLEESRLDPPPADAAGVEHGPCGGPAVPPTALRR